MRELSQTLTKSPAIELDAPKSGDGIIEGYGSTFGGEPDSFGHVILPGAFTQTLIESKARGETPVMLWAHAMERPIGRWTDLVEDSRGLHVRGRLNLKTSEGREAFEHVKAGDTTGLSIGCHIPDLKYIGDGVSEIARLDLVEVSIVTIPANRNARITQAKSIETKGDLVDVLREVGLPKRAATIIGAAGWKAFKSEPDTTEQIAALAAQIDRATALFHRKP